jgi:hypothetical protein
VPSDIPEVTATLFGSNTEVYRNTQLNGWLQAPAEPAASSFSLHECVLSSFDVVELFQHFEDAYLPFFSILEPVTSYTALFDTSRLLFWTIILIAARWHKRHHVRYAEIQAAHGRLFAEVSSETYQNILDLQAALLLCTWPASRKSQLGDPSYMQLGMAISAARQVGLDKPTDEVFFGTRRTNHQLRNHAAHHVKMTWLKCFEMDIQMSLWHGVLPNLALPKQLHTIKSFCQDPNVPPEYAHTINIHIVTAQYLIAVEDSLSPRPSSSVTRMHVHALDAVKAGRKTTWTQQNEFELLTAKLYLFITLFVQQTLAERNSTDLLSASSTFSFELLHAAQACAVDLIRLITSLAAESQAKATPHLPEYHPIPGSPKFSSRVVFFAATVLLRFLDSSQEKGGDDEQAAREAFQRAYHYFGSCRLSQEHINASRTLEVAGRAIGHGHAQLYDHVTTRMAASLMYNVIWLGGLLRGRQNDAEYSPTAAALLNRGTTTQPKAAVNEHLQDRICGTTDAQDLVPIGPVQDEVMFSVGATDWAEFPFGVWDEGLYNDWANNTMQDFEGTWNL